MTAFRTPVPHFQLANAIYAGASVSLYTVNDSGVKTAVLATLYAAPTGTTTLSNPQKLDGDGKFAAPVYIAVPVIASISGYNVGSHDTGVIAPRGTWKGSWVTATRYFSGDLVQDSSNYNIYAVADDYTSGASVAIDVAASHLVIVLDNTAVANLSNVLTTSSVQTVTGAKTFNDGTLKLGGATSGASTLKAPAIAGVVVHTLPTATTTLVGSDTADTLTNKTLTDPIVGTQSAGNNTTKAASTAFVTTAVAAALGVHGTPGGRITLTAATPYTVSDVTAATAVKLALLDNVWTSIYDGSTLVPRQYTAEISLALDSNAAHTNYHQSGKNFDVFEYWTGSAIGIGTGPTWNSGAVAGSDTARGTGAGSAEIELILGRWVNKNSITLRIGSASGDTVVVAARQAMLRGTFRTIANGQTEDSYTKRFVSNLFNAVPRPLNVNDTTSHNYTNATVRQVRATAANKVEYVQCLTGRALKANVDAGTYNSVTANFATLGIGLDSITADSATFNLSWYQVGGNNVASPVGCRYTGFAGLGYHYIAPLESSNTNGTQVWVSVSLFAELAAQ